MAYVNNLQVNDLYMTPTLSGGLLQGGQIDFQNHLDAGNHIIQMTASGLNIIANLSGLSGAAQNARSLTIQNLGWNTNLVISDVHSNSITFGATNGIQVSISGQLGASGQALQSISGGWLKWV